MTTPPDPADLSAPAQAVLVAVGSDHPGPLPEDAPAEGKKKSRSQFADIWRRFRRNKLAMAGLVVVVVMVVLALLQPIITPYDPYDQNLLNTLQPPSADHWFGTDVLGRDLYSGMLYGLQLALIVGLCTMIGSMTIGVTLGAIVRLPRRLLGRARHARDRPVPGLPVPDRRDPGGPHVRLGRPADDPRAGHPRLADRGPADARPDPGAA